MSNFLVIHTLRCIGAASEHRLADITGLGTTEVVEWLNSLRGLGLVFHDEGGFGGWGLTDAGRDQDVAWTRSELLESGAEPILRDAYRGFLDLNPKLLDVCGAWQMTVVAGTPQINDHSDVGHDSRLIDRLVAIDNKIQPILEPLGAHLIRFVNYRRRLSAALDRVEAWDLPYFADNPDSYHGVWFQLHEDLLTSLGIDRHTEPPAT